MRKKQKFRIIFYSTFVVACLLAVLFFFIFFIRLQQGSENYFFSQVRTVHQKVTSDEDYCLMFAEDKHRLVDSLELSRRWVLVGTEFSEKEKTVNIKLDLSSETRKYFDQSQAIEIYYEFINTENEELTDSIIKGKFEEDSLQDSKELIFNQDVAIVGLSPGVYKVKIILEFACGSTEEVYENLLVSYPFYVVWTFDWEGYDVKDSYLKFMDDLCEKHKNIPLSHLVNPRLFITPTITNERRDELKNWLLERESSRGDSIGLHLHLFYENLAAAGIKLPEKNEEELLQTYIDMYIEPSSTSTVTSSLAEEFNKNKLKKKQIYDIPYWGYAYDDGYDIPLTYLNESELDKLLKWSITKFTELGFKKPITFRAGGWFLDEQALQVLENNGFVVDTSGRTKYNLGTKKMPGHWDLPITSQPYRPNINDQNSAAPPNMNIWEFPNNGADSWWYSARDMQERFNLNWGAIGEPLYERRVVVYLSHPDWFYVDKPKVDDLFNYIDSYSYLDDKGPVIYANLEKVYQVWENNY
ncbi:MAG: hypothetical protein GF349_03700 [Candidatus Magasanikbacteria bacterium]|nr:hypothetical protein [Candidatus Magasanikbacteria bacterium]